VRFLFKKKRNIPIVIGIFVLAYLLFAVFGPPYPDLAVLKTKYPVPYFSAGEKRYLFKLTSARPARWVSLGSVSPIAVQAIRLSEDSGFFQHDGFDAKEMKESLKKNLKTLQYARGGSTITQQVVKNVFLSNRKTLRRKIKELVLAYDLDKELSKRRILEIYLNIAEWGDGIFGITEASAHYFHKHPAYLTAREGAFLAMLLPNPKQYSSSFRQRSLTRFARKRIHSILGKLAATGYLTHEEMKAEKETPFWFEE